MKNIVCISIICLLAGASGRADELSVLPEKDREMLRAYLNGLAVPCFAQRRARVSAIKTPEEHAAYQQRMRTFLLERAGGVPERTPLNARVVGRGERKDFRYERILFESQPGLLVTAVLYLPPGPPPYPAVLVPCGHSENGKAHEPYQRVCMLLVRNGFAVFCYDPPGQGERYAYLDPAGKALFGPTMEHSVLGTACALTGTNLAAFMIRDGMRAVDYLQSRADIDPARIGCTGNSGGGTQTAYLMALDDRLVAAAPSCYLTSFERLLATIGPQDVEQDFFGQIPFGLDHADFLHLRAPKPVRMCVATRDFFDITGAKDTFREASQAYALLGFPDRVDLVEADETHGFSPPLRRAATQWMNRWLRQTEDFTPEDEAPLFSEQELRCTPNGQTALVKGAKTIPDILEHRESLLAKQRARFWAEQPRAAALEQVRELIAAPRPEDCKVPSADVVATVSRPLYRIEKVLLYPEEGIVLPALIYWPGTESLKGMVFCHGQEKSKYGGEGGFFESLVSKNVAVLSVDLRGFGETESQENKPDWRDKCGQDYTNFLRAYLLGKSLVGMRTGDIWACAAYLKTRLREGIPIGLDGRAEAAIPALHAAALCPELFSEVTLKGGITSWSEVVHTPRARGQLTNTVYNALAFYDLPDLKQCLGGKLTEEPAPLSCF